VTHKSNTLSLLAGVPANHVTVAVIVKVVTETLVHVVIIFPDTEIKTKRTNARDQSKHCAVVLALHLRGSKVSHLSI